MESDLESNGNNDDRTESYIPLTANLDISHYKIIKKIGSGGMGEVYLAEDRELNRKVALKFLPSHLCKDDDCRKRFKREAQATAKLSHPNIVTIHEVGDYNDRPYFVMEHIEGLSLKEYSKNKELSIDQILEFGIQICEGINAAHEKGVIHRDIKPSNILVDLHGRIKIVDFGLASVIGSDHLTKTGSTLGTIGYMSPEQVLGKEIDHRSDLFSLSVVLYELISKQNPFRRSNEAATLKAVIDDIPEPLARFKNNLPEGLQAIFDKALGKDVVTRYQHADDMLSDMIRIKRSGDTQSQKISNSKLSQRPLKITMIVSTIILLLAVITVIITKPWSIVSDSNEDEKIMLVVLPFENLGDPEDEYFADGITDEITTNLTKISGLNIISRSSAIKYKNSDKSLSKIGKELKVTHVLEGTVRWDKTSNDKKVRINLRLIQIDEDVHLWADRFDAVLTDIFGVQSSIARDVTEALNITLLQSEKTGLDVINKVHPEAFEYYLRGKQYFDIGSVRENNLILAEKMFLKAIELDPKFVKPLAELSSVYTEMVWDKIDVNQDNLKLAKSYIDKAFEIDPSSPEVHQALGWYYYHGLRDFDMALEEFDKVLSKQPNNSLAIASSAWVKRRQGNWSEAVSRLKTTIMLDPQSNWYNYEMANTFFHMRKYKEAQYYIDRALDLQPDVVSGYLTKGMIVLSKTGILDSSKAVINDGRQFIDNSPVLNYLEAAIYTVDEQYDEALALISSPDKAYLFGKLGNAEYHILKGLIYENMGDTEKVRLQFDSAKTTVEQYKILYPEDPNYYSTLGIIYARLDEPELAKQHALKAVELLPVSIDALTGPDYILNLAQVYTLIGEEELAIDNLEYLFSIPNIYSVNNLILYTVFKKLREHPRFIALMEKHNTN